MDFFAPNGQVFIRQGQVRWTSPAGFADLKRMKDIDRALPRLVVAVDLMERFGYGEIALTSRQLGTGLIIEAGLR